MTITTLSSREFQQNANRAQKASREGPVFITNRGQPTQVLLSYEDYRRMTGQRRTLVEALAMPGLSDIDVDFEAPHDTPRPADLS